MPTSSAPPASRSFPATPIVAAATLSDAGTGWRGLGEGALIMTSGTHVKFPGMPADAPLAQPKARKMMSRGAYLAARCLADLLDDVTWRRANVGYFLGVGASGGSLDDVTALLAASIVDGNFSLARFGDAGLAACNPLLAFQLMNNFTLCHGAILEGVGGPNSALFSRGAGTTAALIEAAYAIADGDCEHAIAGGADSAIHPVTHAELVRDGFIERGQRPTEGAALIALGAGGTGARILGVLEGAAIVHGQTSADLDRCFASFDAPAIDAVVIAPWGPPVGNAIERWARQRFPKAEIANASYVFGDTLAASHALGWVCAIDILVAGFATHVLVVGAGVDGQTAMAGMTRGDA
jgi:hypothetical protein